VNYRWCITLARFSLLECPFLFPSRRDIRVLFDEENNVMNIYEIKHGYLKKEFSIK